MRSSTSTRLRGAGALAAAAAVVLPLAGCMPNHEPPARNIADTVVAPAPGAMGVQPGVETVPEVTQSPGGAQPSEAGPPSVASAPPAPAAFTSETGAATLGVFSASAIRARRARFAVALLAAQPLELPL